MTPDPPPPPGIPSPVQPIVDRLGTATSDAEPSLRADVGGRPAITVLDRFAVPAGATPPTGPGAALALWWEGRTCSLVDAGPGSVVDAAGFLITIHPDHDGEPELGRRVASRGFDVGEVERTVLATAPGRCGPVVADHVHRRYRALLRPASSIEPGRSYWLSVLALVPTAATVWAWRASRSGDDGFSLRVVGDAGPVVVELDRAFAIETVTAE